MNVKPEFDSRTSERTKTRIYATVRYVKQSAKARVIDLSETGIALELDSPIDAAAQSQVSVDSNDLGHLTGTVVWNHSGRIGIKLDITTNTLAQISSYFRFFHQDIAPSNKP